MLILSSSLWNKEMIVINLFGHWLRSWTPYFWYHRFSISGTRDSSHAISILLNRVAFSLYSLRRALSSLYFFITFSKYPGCIIFPNLFIGITPCWISLWIFSRAILSVAVDVGFIVVAGAGVSALVLLPVLEFPHSCLRFRAIEFTVIDLLLRFRASLREVTIVVGAGVSTLVR